MNAVTDVLNSQAAPAQDGQGAQGNQGLGKDDFLKLLVTQLNYQDPLSPMKNEEFVAQLAQFSGVEQLVGVNERLDALTMGQVSQNSAASVSFIGKSVRATADWVDYGGTEPATVNYELKGAADAVTLTLTDGEGNVVRTEEFKGQAKGPQTWAWDGRNQDGSPLKAGTYHVKLTAKDAAGNDVGAYAVAEGRVSSVTYQNGYPELMVGDHKVTLSDIIEIKE